MHFKKKSGRSVEDLSKIWSVTKIFACRASVTGHSQLDHRQGNGINVHDLDNMAQQRLFTVFDGMFNKCWNKNNDAKM
jgi:hypothetical protein